MKKKKMAFAAIVVLIGLLASCNDNGSTQTPGTTVSPDSKGAQVYGQYCVSCHGKDGKLGLSGASNLMVSVLTKPEVKEVVTNGRRLMSPFKDVLKQDEIDAVADYVLTLRR
jgi:mono/diheme cytochrome c family protein